MKTHSPPSYVCDLYDAAIEAGEPLHRCCYNGVMVTIAGSSLIGGVELLLWLHDIEFSFTIILGTKNG